MRRPDIVRELTILVRQQDIAVLRELVAERGDEIARVLGAPADRVAALVHATDAEVVARLEPAIRRLGAARRRTSAVNSEQRATAAAAELRSGGVQREGAVHLDPRLLLGTVLSHPAKYIAFDLTDDVCVAVERRRLRAASEVLRRKTDLSAYVDERALHLRWRSGRGGLSFSPQVVARSDWVFVIDLRRLVRPALSELPPVHRQPSSAFADALGDFATLG